MPYLYTPRDRQTQFGTSAPAGGTATGGAPRQPQGSGTFENLSAWLNANRTGGERMGADLAGKLTSEAAPLEAVANREGTTAENARTVETVTGDQYDGTVDWNKPAAEVTDAERSLAGTVGEKLRAAGTSAGRQDLIGGSRYDGALLNRWGSAPIEDTRNRFGAIADFVRGYERPESGNWGSGSYGYHRGNRPNDNRTVPVPPDRAAPPGYGYGEANPGSGHAGTGQPPPPPGLGSPGFGEGAPPAGTPKSAYPEYGEWNGWGRDWY